jgi:ABC-type transporter Mla MlaB component
MAQQHDEGAVDWTVHYDATTSTLELAGSFDHGALAAIGEKIERAHRRTACLLTIDLTRTDGVTPHTLGRLVHLCHSFPGTFVRLPVATAAALA